MREAFHETELEASRHHANHRLAVSLLEQAACLCPRGEYDGSVTSSAKNNGGFSSKPRMKIRNSGFALQERHGCVFARRIRGSRGDAHASVDHEDSPRDHGRRAEETGGLRLFIGSTNGERSIPGDTALP